MEVNKYVFDGVAMAVDKLTDEELASISMAVFGDFDPRPVMGYEKVKHLFTENNGLKMHNDVRLCFERLVAERFVK